MSRLTTLRRALEDADLKDEPVVIKGPLSDAFTQSLQQIYSKDQDTANQDGNVATESQANDALAMQALARALQQEFDPASAVNPTVYAVSSDNVTPEDVIAVTTDMVNQDPDDMPNYALVIDTTTAKAQAGNGDNPEAFVDMTPSALATALESIARHHNVKIYPSLEAYAMDRYI
jgi:hypothetical protein